MNSFIQATATKALVQYKVSQTEYRTLTYLVEDPSLTEQDLMLARRVLYGVRHGIVSLT